MGDFADKASDTWNDAKAYAGRQWQAASNQAERLAAGAQRFWDEHGEQIKATAATVLVGAAVFTGCAAVAAAVTGGTATPLCITLAGAAGGAVYGNMTCPEGQSVARCTAVGALSGGVAGLTFALTGGLGFFASGALSGLAGDAVDQALTTGEYDWRRGVTAAATGGALGWLGGRFARPATSCTRNSFVPGTPVLMADGSRKPIEDVHVGDKVIATDPETGRTEARTVEARIVGEGRKNLVEVTIDTDGDRGDRTDTLVATDMHPFWLADGRGWTNAEDLRGGDWLRTASGTFVQVTATTSRTVTATVHNLTVTGIHTYYVLAGDQPVSSTTAILGTTIRISGLRRNANGRRRLQASSRGDQGIRRNCFICRSILVGASERQRASGRATKVRRHRN